jgi:hypothetical protein
VEKRTFAERFTNGMDDAEQYQNEVDFIGRISFYFMAWNGEFLLNFPSYACYIQASRIVTTYSYRPVTAYKT